MGKEKKKDFKGKFSPRYVVILQRLFFLNTGFTNFVPSLNWGCDPRAVATVKCKINIKNLPRAHSNLTNIRF
jgi:hypothetical protein